MSDFSPDRDAQHIDRLAAALLSHPLDPVTRDALTAYVALVASWNRKLNLTGAGTPQALVEVLLGDALMLAARDITPDAAHVIDVGSGAGAPIIPLLLTRPDLRALAVEPRAKRATFIRTASARLGLVPRMRVLEARIDPEAATHDDLGTFDLASSRATFEPDRWLALGLTLAPRVLVMLGSAAPPPVPSGARLAATRDYTLPFSSTERALALYQAEEEPQPGSRDGCRLSGES